MLRKYFDKDSYEILDRAKDYMSIEIIGSAVVFITLPIITRLLSPDEFGILSIFVTMISALSIVLTLMLNSAIKINYVRKIFPHKSYLFSNIVFLLGFNLISLGLLAALNSQISAFMNIPKIVSLLAGMTSVFMVFIITRISLFQIQKKSKHFAVITGIRRIGIAVISIGAMYSMHENVYMGQVYTNIIITFILAVYSIFSLFKETEYRFRWIYVQDSLKYGLPLLPHAMSSIVLNFFDQVIINQLIGPEKTGIYSFGYRIGTLMQIVFLAMNRSWLPTFWEKIKSKDWKSMNDITKKYTAYVFFIGVGLLLFATDLADIIATEDYSESLYVTPIVVMSFIICFLYTYYSQITSYYRFTWLISLNTIIAAAVNISLNYILIPQYGYIAAAWTTMISYSALFILNFISTKYIVKFHKLNFLNILPYLILVSCIFISVLFINNLQINYLLILLIKMMFLALAGIVFFGSRLFRIFMRAI